MQRRLGGEAAGKRNRKGPSPGPDGPGRPPQRPRSGRNPLPVLHGVEVWRDPLNDHLVLDVYHHPVQVGDFLLDYKVILSALA